ncbi:glycosyltransferase [Burkholderiaceae bacterium UC74_6]
MRFLLIPFFVAVLVSIAVIISSRRHGHFSADHDLSGPQKFHATPVPRIGGVGIFLGLALCAIASWWQGRPDAEIGLKLLFCGLPAFIAGLVEDITKQVSPAKRLAATALSAALAAGLMDALITRTDIVGLDSLFQFAAVGFAVTVFAVAGVANSVNIIDGFNGLASMCVMLMLAAFAYVSYEVGDLGLTFWSIAGIGATLGFFVWNFPAGLMFLGDGGAYFLGFLVAEIGILLVVRHPEVSPLFALLVCIYPVFETLFSIYRRRFIRATPPGLPDGIHLHSLIYRRLVRWAISAEDARAMTRRNSMTSPYLWMLCISSLVPAVLFWDSTLVLLMWLVLFCLVYVVLYWRIVRFKTPRVLTVARRRLDPSANAEPAAQED